MVSEDHESHRRKNAHRFVSLGSRNLMEQVTAARGRVDMYFGKVSNEDELTVCLDIGSVAKHETISQSRLSFP